MSLRRRLLQLKADWGKWEDRLAAATGILLLAAVAANVGRFFSVRKDPAFLGTVLSWLYVIAWFLGAALLRNRERWVRAAGIVRWTAAGSILLALAASAGSRVSLLSSLCTIPYALFVSAYGGLSQGAWVYYVLPLVQAVIAALLARRLRRRRAAEREMEM